MDFSISEDQQAIRDLAAQILSDRCTDDYQNEFDTTSEPFDRALWKQLADSSLLGTALPEDVGGMGMGMSELSGLLEEQGRTLAQVPLVPVLIEAALPIAAFGTPEQRTELLPGVVSGAHWLAGALQERHADPLTPGTRARQEGATFVLDGEKVAVPVADGAHRLVVSATAETGGTALFLVDPSGAGVTLQEQPSTTRRPSYRVTLSGAAATRIGDERPGDALAWTVARARAGLAAITLGVATEALRRTADYISNRKQFGKPIGTFQGVALRAADGYIDLECMRTTLWQANFALDTSDDASTEVAVAKWWACRGGQRVVHSAQHLHGGIGVDIEYPIHRFFLWAKALEIELGGASQSRRDLGRLLATTAA